MSNDAAIAEILGRLGQVEARLDRARRARAKYDERIEDLERKAESFRLVLGELGHDTNQDVPRECAGAPSLADAVMLVLPGLGGQEITPSIVSTRLPPDFANVETSAISGVLIRLARGPDAQLELVERGRGRRQSRYRLRKEGSNVMEFEKAKATV